jgi:hypothetical protein
MLPEDVLRSIEPRDPEVPVEVSPWAVPEVDPLLPYEPLPVEEPVPLWP